MHEGSWSTIIEAIRGAEYRFGLITSDTPVHRVEFAPGLTDSEIAATEARFSVRFPSDLREFLQTSLPVGPRFPDWRSGDQESLRDWLSSPAEGVLFDVEHNAFWLDEWGSRPEKLHDALDIAAGLLKAAPNLIPIYGHRMMPDEPSSPGNPVFSVHQTDIIHYGFDLTDYLRCEFNLSGREPWPTQVRPIRFWNIEKFQNVRWREGSAAFDNRRGVLPT